MPRFDGLLSPLVLYSGHFIIKVHSFESHPLPHQKKMYEAKIVLSLREFQSHLLVLINNIDFKCKHELFSYKNVWEDTSNKKD